MTPSGWIVQVIRGVTLAVVVAYAIATTFVALVMPYRFWDSLAFSSWSRSIADTGDLWANTNALSVSRPLFYVPQGLLWRFVSDEEWVGRTFSASFAIALVVCIWFLARRMTADPAANALLPPLAVMVVLTSSVFATFVAAGMTDVPVAAATAATALVLWSRLPTWLVLPVAAIASAATILAKPSGLLALAGLVAATWVLSGRSSLVGIGGVAGGVVAALAYNLWHASRLNTSLMSLLSAGNDDFWLARGDAARWEALVGGDWVGAGARLLVLLGLIHGIARAMGARPRIALAIGSGTALAWSLAGPALAGDEVAYPFDGSVVGMVSWLGLACALVAATLVAERDPVPRRTYAAFIVWLLPIGLLWAWQRPDEVRLLAPAWPALALLAAAVLTSVSLALLRIRPAAALAPAGAVALIAIANVVSVDGLGRSGWRDLLDLGSTRWGERAEMENFAYGPFSYHLNLARENVVDGDRIVSSDGRLTYFFPGQVEVAYARSCAELDGARFYSFLASGESLEFAQLERQPTDPLAWIQCASPPVVLVGEQEGIYAAFVVGGDPVRAPTPEDCRIVSTPGQLVDAVFGRDLHYAEATALLAQALGVGFEGTRIERTGCSAFRVVVTGVPEDASIQADFARQAERVGLPVEYEAAQRFPEVAPDVAPVSS